MNSQINFYQTEQFSLQLDNNQKIWITSFIQNKGFTQTEINYTFLSDEELLKINQQYLHHDYFTDIITFDNSILKTISADIFISIDRVRDNAKKNQKDFTDELHRVLIHGILHCMGYADKTHNDKLQMRKEEDKALQLFHVKHQNSLQ